MSTIEYDIIVPVWNRPIETRACLVRLVEHSPAARLILVDNGSDRETESLLEEFAEALDERALLISSRTNLGFVKAVNLGLARVEAEFAAVVRQSSLVPQGWLEPLLALGRSTPEAGVIVPGLRRASEKRSGRGGRHHVSTREVAHGDFGAMMIRKGLYERIGGFDEAMDGAEWCLKDYSRRALREGFLTFAAEGRPVEVCDDPPLGSTERREELRARSAATSRARWGEERAFCVHFPQEADPAIVRHRLDLMLRGARQGHSFTVLIAAATFRELAREGYDTRHRNIRLEKLPRFFAASQAGKMVASLGAATPGLVPVAGVDGVAVAGVAGGIPFVELERLVVAADLEKFGIQA